MSRLGKIPVAIPGGVTVTLENGLLTVKGPKATLTREFKNDVEVKLKATQ